MYILNNYIKQIFNRIVYFLNSICIDNWTSIDKYLSSVISGVTMIISNFNIHQNDVIDVPNPTKR